MGADDRARHVAILAIGRNEGGDQHDPRLVEQPRHLGDAADVLRPVLRRKTQVARKAVAHVVAVQHIGHVAQIQQAPLQLEGQRRLARARQPSQPDRRRE